MKSHSLRWSFRCEFFLILLLLTSTASAGGQSTAGIGQWGRFETVVTNATRYADPYRDVNLQASYTKPDGTQVDFWGFFDGGDLWKIRYMPDQLGTWSYSARFSDGQPGPSGTFEVVPSDIPGMIATDETNPLWFGFKGGRHGLVRSLHIGDRFFASNWDAAKRTAFLDWVRQQGYNMLSIASHYLNREIPGRGAGWETPDLWPLDAAQYQKMEAILDDLARRQILVFPFAGFFGRDSDFPKDAADQEHYIRYTLARIGPYWNVLLNVGGPEPLLRNNPFLSAEEVNALGRKISSLDVFDHALTVHNAPGQDQFRDEEWLTYGTLQGPKTVDLAELSRGLLESHHPDKPLYAQETLWSGNMYHMRNLGGRDYSDDELRKNTFVINLSATVLNFADNSGDLETGDSSSGFSGTMDLADVVQHRHDIVKRVWDFFETVPFYRMKPCQAVVSAGYCLGEHGRQYLVYLPTGGSVDLRIPGGPYTVEWINARDTGDRRRLPSTPTGQGLTAPAGGDDWVLYLVKQ